KYAVQYQARIPSHGLRRHTGTSPTRMETKRMSLMAGACRRGCRAGGPLFHRDALGEVARLVDVAGPQDSDVVGEELERDDRYEWRQKLGRRGHEQRVVGAPNHLVIPAVADGDDTAATRLDLLHVSHHAVIGAVPRGRSEERRVGRGWR